MKIHGKHDKNTVDRNYVRATVHERMTTWEGKWHTFNLESVDPRSTVETWSPGGDLWSWGRTAGAIEDQDDYDEERPQRWELVLYVNDGRNKNAVKLRLKFTTNPRDERKGELPEDLQGYFTGMAEVLASTGQADAVADITRSIVDNADSARSVAERQLDAREEMIRKMSKLQRKAHSSEVTLFKHLYEVEKGRNAAMERMVDNFGPMLIARAAVLMDTWIMEKQMTKGDSWLKAQEAVQQMYNQQMQSMQSQIHQMNQAREPEQEQ